MPYGANLLPRGLLLESRLRSLGLRGSANRQSARSKIPRMGALHEDVLVPSGARWIHRSESSRDPIEGRRSSLALLSPPSQEPASAGTPGRAPGTAPKAEP